MSFPQKLHIFLLNVLHASCFSKWRIKFQWASEHSQLEVMSQRYFQSAIYPSQCNVEKMTEIDCILWPVPAFGWAPVIIYGVTDNFAHYLALNLCMIIAKYYLYTASRKEEEFYFDALLAFLTNKIKIEKHKSTSQINMWESHLFIADALN